MKKRERDEIVVAMMAGPVPVYRAGPRGGEAVGVDHAQLAILVIGIGGDQLLYDGGRLVAHLQQPTRQQAEPGIGDRHDGDGAEPGTNEGHPCPDREGAGRRGNAQAAGHRAAGDRGEGVELRSGRARQNHRFSLRDEG